MLKQELIKKLVIIRLKISAEDKEKLWQASGIMNLTLSSFIRKCCLYHAKKIIKKHGEKQQEVLI